MRRSCGLSTRFFFSRPATMRSTAWVKSSSVTESPPRRVARSAASFTRLARSAPENPGVSAATCSRSTPGASFTLRTCTFRICSRSGLSGRSTRICRSKRPARNSAGSRISGRLVAASSTSPVLGSKPSSSTRNWFSVCSRSSWPPSAPVPRARPSASSSSMKMIAGALARACSNRSRTRAAPTPTNISTNSEPEIEQHALRNARAQTPVLLRVLQELDHLLQLGLCLINPRDVGEGDAGLVLDVDLRAALADAHEAAAEPLAHASREEVPHAEEHERWHHPGKQVAHECALVDARVLHIVLVELVGELRLDAIGDGHRFAALRRLQLAGDVRIVDDDLCDLALGKQLLEIAIGQHLHRLGALPGLLDEDHGEDREDNVGDVKARAAFHGRDFPLNTGALAPS